MAKDLKRPRAGNVGNSSRGGSSLLTGLLMGLGIGVAVSIGVAFYVNKSANPFIGKLASAPAAIASVSAPYMPEVLRPNGSKDELPVLQNASGPSAVKASGTDRFDFYTLLPGLADKNSKPVTPEKSEASPLAKVEPSKGSWLQVGAFQNEQDADNLKAKLALIGIEARIQTQDIPDKGLWHRVRIGPFSNPADIDKARAQLQSNSIESTVVKSN